MAPYLSGQVVVGAVNAPRQTVLAGPDEPLDEAGRALREAGFVCRPGAVAQPLSQPRTRTGLPRRGRTLRRGGTAHSVRACLSAYTAAPLGRSDIDDPGFWARQPVAPVLFWPALEALLAGGDHLLVEVGPGQGLSAVARRHPAVRRGTSAVVSLLPARAGGAGGGPCRPGRRAAPPGGGRTPGGPWVRALRYPGALRRLTRTARLRLVPALRRAGTSRTSAVRRGGAVRRRPRR
ncbi:hypothetical protein SVIOM342S_07880 [Streptomyces violaceorubidus]